MPDPTQQSPDKSELRNFGLTTVVIVVALFGLLLPWLFDRGWPVWPWLLATVLATWAWLAPASLAPVYRGWMRFGHVLGWINTRIILGLMFYTVFLAVGLLLRLLGKDPMHRRLDAAAASYRTPSVQRTPDHLEKPY